MVRIISSGRVIQHIILLCLFFHRSGRGLFQRLCFAISSNSSSNSWNCVRFIAFDLPSPNFIQMQEAFESRLLVLLKVLPYQHPFVIPLIRVQCNKDITFLLFVVFC